MFHGTLSRQKNTNSNYFRARVPFQDKLPGMDSTHITLTVIYSLAHIPLHQGMSLSCIHCRIYNGHLQRLQFWTATKIDLGILVLAKAISLS